VLISEQGADGLEVGVGFPHAVVSPLGADWHKASITHATAQQMMVRGLIDRDQAATRFVLTEQGRAVLTALIGPSEDR
jgi:hypothetical protein